MTPNGGSLGGDIVVELVRVCWVSHDQFVLSDLQTDSLKKQKIITKIGVRQTTGQGQAEVSNLEQSPKGTERQGTQNGQNREN